MFFKQRTLSKPASISGIGLHKGVLATMQLRPAPANTGIIFNRTDIGATFTLSAKNIVNTPLCTVLKNSDNQTVSTTEHFMAALASVGVDNLYVDINGPELPILDGSSLPFLIVLREAGVNELSSTKKVIKLKKTITVRDGDKWAKIEPYNGFKVDFEIDFNHHIIQQTTQRMAIDFNQESFHTEISRARTFGFSQDIETLRNNGLALGGSMDNAILIDKHRVLNPHGLRYEDEFIRHKILDLVGDMYMQGHQILGSVSAYKSGHALNNKLLREIIENESCWEWHTKEEINKEIKPERNWLPSFS